VIFLSKISSIKHKVAVMSAKGGVGKSRVAISIARVLSKVYDVGILDLDLDDPDVLSMLGLPIGGGFQTDAEGMLTLEYAGMRLLSMEQLPFSERALLLDGCTLGNIAREYISLSPKWGVLDYLVIDSSPGTSSVPQNIVKELHKRKDGVIVVTTPEPEDILGAKRCIDMVRDYGKKLLGVVINKSIIECECGKVIRLGTTPEEIANLLGLPILFEIPYMTDKDGMDWCIQHVKITSKLRRF